MSKFFGSALLLFLVISCTVQRNSTTDDGKIEIVFLQVNDVYEIAPLSAGKEGGMARVAALKKQYSSVNPNTFLVMAGDFLSPSVYNSLHYQGKPIRGKQMVESMNAAGFDFAIFGNHEFDIKENELQQRIDESEFQWISSNVFHKVKDSITRFRKTGDEPFPESFIMKVADADGTTARIGLIGVCLPFNKASYVSYTDALATAKKLYAELKDSVDAVVAITHQTMAEDELLARELPGLAMILGGHEHDQHMKRSGDLYITKAMANARSAFAIQLQINKRRGKTTFKVIPQLVQVNEKISFDSLTAKVVQKWMDIASDNYSSIGFDAANVVVKNGDPLDGRETMVRSQSTNFTQIITSSVATAAPMADVVIINAGSVRVDDILHPPITEYDIIRSLPYGGAIREVEMKGSLLLQILETGMANRGSGGYLHVNEELKKIENEWILNGRPVMPASVYRVALAEFLLTGMEANLDYLTETNSGIIKTYPKADQGHSLSDIRLAVVRYLENRAKF